MSLTRREERLIVWLRREEPGFEAERKEGRENGLVRFR